MDIQGINHVGIRVRDLGATRDFYGRIGFEFVAGPLGPEPVAIMRHPCGVVLNFILNATDEGGADNVLMDGDAKLAGYTHMALEVRDLDAACDALSRLGIPLSGGPIEAGGARFVFVRDPDSNVVEFNQPATPGGFEQSGH